MGWESGSPGKKVQMREEEREGVRDVGSVRLGPGARETADFLGRFPPFCRTVSCQNSS